MTPLRHVRPAAAIPAALLTALLAAAPAAGQEIRALAVSPDGSTVMAAGGNRTLYTIDAATMDVTDRRYIPEMVTWLDYSPDGRLLYMLTDEDVLSAHSGGSMKTMFTIEDVDVVSFVPEAGRIAVMENRYDGGIVRLLDAASGEVLTRVELPDLRTSLIALAEDGGSAIILTSSESSDSEAKESTPSDMKGYERYLHRQMHDGYVSTVVALNLEDGSFESAETFYRASGGPDAVTMLDGRMLVLNNTSDSALVSADGAAELVNLGSDYVAFSALAADRASVVLSGGSKVGMFPLTGAEAGPAARSLDAGRMPGPSERASALDEAADGTIWIGTSAYRLWKIAPGAPEVEIAPIN